MHSVQRVRVNLLMGHSLLLSWDSWHSVGSVCGEFAVFENITV